MPDNKAFEQDRLNEESDSQGMAPTVSQGGSVPGKSENSFGGNHAYPRPDATRAGTLPQAIKDSMGDRTGNKSRDQLAAIAVEMGIDVQISMTRAELAGAVNAKVS